MSNFTSTTNDGPSEHKRENTQELREIGRLPDIWSAVREDDLDKVKRILLEFPDMLNEQEYQCGTLLTPLHVAAARRNWRIARYLMEQERIEGWKIRDHLGRSVLALAYTTDDDDFIEMFRRRFSQRHTEPELSIVSVAAPGDGLEH